jgi:hypothetical protein
LGRILIDPDQLSSLDGERTVMEPVRLSCETTTRRIPPPAIFANQPGAVGHSIDVTAVNPWRRLDHG